MEVALGASADCLLYHPGPLRKPPSDAVSDPFITSFPPLVAIDWFVVLSGSP